jgi:hypothetical protein
VGTCPDQQNHDNMVEPKKFIEYIYNDTVTFKCAAGYMLKGPKTRQKMLSN